RIHPNSRVVLLLLRLRSRSRLFARENRGWDRRLPRIGGRRRGGGRIQRDHPGIGFGGPGRLALRLGQFFVDFNRFFFFTRLFKGTTQLKTGLASALAVVHIVGGFKLGHCGGSVPLLLIEIAHFYMDQRGQIFPFGILFKKSAIPLLGGVGVSQFKINVAALILGHHGGRRPGILFDDLIVKGSRFFKPVGFAHLLGGFFPLFDRLGKRRRFMEKGRG